MMGNLQTPRAIVNFFFGHAFFGDSLLGNLKKLVNFWLHTLKS